MSKTNKAEAKTEAKTAKHDAAPVVKPKTGKGNMLSVPVALLYMDKNQNTRKDTSYSEALADSMKTQGMLQPILVTDRLDGKQGYQVVAGYQRTEAALKLGWTHIPAMYLPSLTKEDMLFANIKENAERKSLTPYEEALGYKRLADMGHSPTEQAKRFQGLQGHDLATAGKQISASYITNLLRCLSLAPAIVKAWSEQDKRVSVNWMVNGLPAEASIAEQMMAWEQRQKMGGGSWGWLVKNKDGVGYRLKDETPGNDGGVDSKDGGNGQATDGNGAPAKTVKPPRKDKLEAAFEAAKAKAGKDDDSYEAGIRDALGWALAKHGFRSGIEGITDIEAAN